MIVREQGSLVRGCVGKKNGDRIDMMKRGYQLAL